MKIPIADLLSRQKSIILIQKTFRAYLARKHKLLDKLAKMNLEMDSHHPDISHLTFVLNSIHHPSSQVQSIVKELKMKLASLEYVYVDVLDSKIVMMDDWELVI